MFIMSTRHLHIHSVDMSNASTVHDIKENKKSESINTGDVYIVPVNQSHQRRGLGGARPHV